MRSVRAAWVLIVAAAIASCGGDPAPPTAPGVPPPGIVEVFPAPGSRGVPHGAEISARFDRAIDTTSVGDTTITLRVDARYVPITLSWDATATRVTIRPLAPLALLRTHTVRIAAPLRAADGGTLGTTFAWQFRTSALRPLSSPWPPDGARNESPFVRLAWALPESPGGVVYLLRWGADSLAATSDAPPLRATTATELFRGATWPHGTTTYWSVTADHPETGETIAGPVWRFSTLPADTPTDSVTLPLSDWGYLDRSEGEAQECFGTTVVAGGETWICAIRWDLEAYRGRKLAGAAIQLAWVPANRIYSTPALYSTTYWDACGIGYPGPPYEIGVLASGIRIDGIVVGFGTDELTAHTEAMLRYRGYHGFKIRTTIRQEYDASRCRLLLWYYREPEPTTASGAP